MKNYIIKITQFLLGRKRYLKFFSIFKIRTISYDRRKSDYLFFENLLPKDATVIVAGACTGITTVPFARNKSQRKVIAYEPLPLNFSTLNQVIAHFRLDNVKTYPIGLGNKKEQREIIVPVVNGLKKHGMAHIQDKSIMEFNEGETLSIELDKLDSRPEINQTKIEALKIVAENFEFQIFEGAKEIIKNNRPLIYCELWPNENRSRVLELIESYNYKIYYRNGDQLILHHSSNYQGKNFIFKPSNE